MTLQSTEILKSKKIGTSDVGTAISSVPSYISFLSSILIAMCLLVGGFYAGKYWGGSSEIVPTIYSIGGSKKKVDVTTLDFDLFWDVWQTLKDGYVEDKLDEKKMYYGAIKGMVAGVGDPATIFLDPEETAQYNDSNQGKFKGIGAELGYQNGVVVIVSPLEGTPAQSAGLRAGDRILQVDGEDMLGKSVYEVVSRIRGEKGTKVTITISREGESENREVEVRRDEINVPAITYEGVVDGISVLDVDRFTEASLTAWQTLWNEVVDEIVADDPKALVLDLRGNSGGYFNAAVWAAGEFLPSGSLVSQQKNRNGEMENYSVSREGRLQSIPMVVLVDKGSASASEILAGALQHYGRAHLIGVNTYGKGTAQQIIDYAGGSSLHITTVKWLLPDGTWINPERVIEPDEKVELSDENFKKGDDPQMEAARKYLNSL